MRMEEEKEGPEGRGKVERQSDVPQNIGGDLLLTLWLGDRRRVLNGVCYNSIKEKFSITWELFGNPYPCLLSTTIHILSIFIRRNVEGSAPKQPGGGGGGPPCFSSSGAEVTTSRKEMALHVGASGRLTSPLLSPLPTPTTSNGVPPRTHTNLLSRTTTNFSFFPSKRWFNVRASTKEETGGSEPSKKSDAGLLDHELLSLVSGAIDADQALRLIGEERRPESGGGSLSVSDCCAVLSAAIDHNNADLAISIFSAMRRSVDPAVLQSREMREMGSSVRIWRWPRPDVRTYACMVLGLAACMRVSDAIQIISDLSRVGVLSGEEVPFGKVVRCPSCMIAIAVAQPQHGTQVAACSKCRYQYELFSGDIVSINSEAISTLAVSKDLLLTNAALTFQHGRED